MNKDLLVFIIYFIVVSTYGVWIYRRKRKTSMDTKDFFLAEGSLTWWAIGSSLIASNISAEQFIGMSGNGFLVGVGVAAYEWIAAIALIIVAVWFIPVYLKNHIFTMPQFLTTRYNETVSLIMAIFWLFLYVLVNLTSILYLGAVAISSLMPDTYRELILFGHQIEARQLLLIGLSLFALVITLGGMKVIGYTDVIQVTVLIIGGLATTYIALQKISTVSGGSGDIFHGFSAMMQQSPDHFHMMLKKPGPGASQSEIKNYLMLPGIAMYFAGQWVVNLNYWGCNQYITQRALGADLKTARTGILFAGLLKLMMPVIVMLPGIAAYVLYQNHNMLQDRMAPGGHLNADNAYSAILTYLPVGLKGLSVAALTAAIVASLAGKANSISTIFTLDIYKKYIKKEGTEKQLVWTGRITILVAMIFSILLTWQDALGIGREGGFTFIQKSTGYISPGIFAMFILGMFWKRTTGLAAIAGIITGVLMSVLFNHFAPDWFGHENIMYTAYNVERDGKMVWEIPFLIAMGWSFVITMVVMITLSLAGPRVNPKAFALDKSMFKVAPSTVALIVITLILLTLLYARFW